MNLTISGEWDVLSLDKQQYCPDRDAYMNMEKNRYTDIIPYEGKRVFLPDDTYINASYIDVGRGIEFVATQAPVSASISDFWNMIWYLNSDTILMLTDLVENSKTKAERYWPNKHIQIMYIDDELTVRFLKKKKVGNFIATKLKLEKGDKSREIVHWWYKAWKDRSVPKDMADIDTMMKILYRTTNIPVIHCSAGCGRTGVICAIQRTINNKESVLDAVRNIRNCRGNMVQTKEQYKLVHHASCELLKVNT